MKLPGNNSPKVLLLAVLLMTIIGTVSSFQQQQQHCYTTSSCSRSTKSPKSIIVALNLSDDNNSNNDNKPQQGDDVGVPKLKLPSLPSLSMPEIDGKESLKKFGVLAATIIAFVIIQKVGLIVSDIVTPELSAEQVKDFRL